MSKRLAMCASILLLSTLALGSALAHDFVLLPTPSRLSAPGSVTLNLWVGDHMAYESERAYDSTRARRFEHHSAKGVVNLARGKRTQADPPFAKVELKTKGGHWVRLDRPPVDIELEAERFNSYLDHERLTSVLAERTRLGEAKIPGRELYTRHLKTFVQVGGASDGQGCKPLGQSFEIVPLQDPALLKKGSKLKVELRTDGKPLPNHGFEAMTKVDGKVMRTQLKSDAEGRATVSFDHPGQWVMRGVEMQRCADCRTAQWKSRWTAFVLDVLPGEAKSQPKACSKVYKQRKASKKAKSAKKGKAPKKAKSSKR